MDQIAEIKTKLPIVDVITEYVPLKKAGRNFKGLCPFHGEKTPSFTVSPERDMWYCFGCQKGGDLLSFVMEIERLTFPEALELLAKRAGVTLVSRPFETEETKLKKRLLEIHHLASEYYHYILTKHALGETAVRYLKERGVKDQSIKTFLLGYAPSGWENVSGFLRKKGYTSDELIASGLSLMGKRGPYDRFRHRIMFPLINHHGDIVGFSGRVLNQTEKESKYINSPETLLYHKGDMVYGINVTKDAIRKSDQVIVVEGEFDVISSFQSGVGNIVAIKGTALTEAQINLLKRFTTHFILSLDQDSAGDAASRRGILIADRAGCTIHVVSSLEGKDPDEAARSNPGLWKKAVEKAVPFYDFVIASALKRFDGNSAYGKKQITDEVLPIMNQITNSIVQSHYVKLLAQKLSLNEEQIITGMKKIVQKPIFAVQESAPKNGSSGSKEEYIAALILQSSTPAEALILVTTSISLSQFSENPVRKILEHLSDFLKQHAHFDSHIFAPTLPLELISVFDRLYLYDVSAFSFSDERYMRELIQAIIHLKQDLIRMKLKEISTKLKQETDSDALGALNDEFQKLSGMLKELAQRDILPY